jgi:hypothetical protein
MRRWLPLALLLVVAVGACDRGAGFAAKVGADTIPASALDRDLGDIAENARFVKASTEKGRAFYGTRKGTYDVAIVAELLNRKITATLVHQEVVRRGLPITPAARDAAEKALRAQVVDVSGDPLLDGFPRRYVDAQIQVQAESGVLEDDESARDPSPGAYEVLLSRLRSEAAVEVSPRFGTWDRSDPKKIRLVPPGSR